MNCKYRRMIEGLEALEVREQRKKHRRKAGASKPWRLYILRCSDGSLYTGITNNISKRLASHQAGKGARFTRARLPVELAYQETCVSRSGALIRECRLKSLSRKKKEELIVNFSALEGFK